MNKTLQIELQELREQIAKEIEGSRVVFDDNIVSKEIQQRVLDLQKEWANIARGKE